MITLFDPLASGPDVSSALTLGGILFAISVPAFWAGLHLRAKTYSRLKSSVDLARSGLAERAIKYFRNLQIELASVLPELSEPFDPLDVILDPARLEEPALKGLRIFRQQKRLVSQLPWLLGICTAIKIVAIIVPFTIAAAATCYILLFALPVVWQPLFSAVLILTALAVLLLGAYGVLDSQIEKAIEDADSSEPVSGA